MTKLGAGIDELEVDLLGETLAGQSKQRLEKKIFFISTHNNCKGKILKN